MASLVTPAEMQAARTMLQKVADAYRQSQAELSRFAKSRQELTARYQETETVFEELKRLDDDANVFKAVGPVLVKQDLMEARSNVSNRLDYIKKDIDRLDAQIKTTESRLLEGEKEIMRLQSRAQGQQG